MIAHIDMENNGRVQTVEEHLEDTAALAGSIGKTFGVESLSWLAGCFHDLGKWRKAFELYIRESESQNIKAIKGKLNHSSAGAVFLYRRYYKGGGLQRLTAQLLCVAILSHHGLNDCMTAEGDDNFNRRIKELNGLDYEEIVQNLKNSSISLETADEYFNKAMNEVERIQRIMSGNKYLSLSFSVGMTERLLLSILIDADRLNTACFYGDRKEKEITEEPWQPWELLGNNLLKKLSSYPLKDGIYALRREISEECFKFSVKESGIYRLTVPTGGAKTLSSMRYAINHARLYKKKRIFYIGPYLSILEQNSDVFREALFENDISLEQQFLLEHHSNVIFEPFGDEEDRTKQYRHLTENWEAKVVITTFVQFLNAVFAGATSSVRRFHSLGHSVIIIDEIQSLPIHMIQIFNLAMNYLKDICGATIVLCSATQPVLDKVSCPIHMSQPPEMMTDVDKLFQQLKRVDIEEKSGSLTTEEVCGFLDGLIDTHGDVLAIVNTKKAAALIYKELKSLFEHQETPVILIHLSTNMCPQNRLDFIKKIKDKEPGKRLVCVSTSLIEAGVDLSFSCVVRSYAGLDSIAQAAGRCNRNQEKEKGVVWLIHYEEEELGRLKQVRKGALCSQSVVELFHKNREKFQGDLLSRPSMEAFYERYYYDKDQKKLMSYPLKRFDTSLKDLLCANRKGCMAYCEKNRTRERPDLMFFQAFKTAGKEFAVIDQETVGVLVPYKKGKELIQQLNGELHGRELIDCLHQCQRYTVGVYRNLLEELNRAGGITRLKNGEVLALKDGFYDEWLGVVTEGRTELLEA